VRIQASNAVTQNEKNDSAEKLKVAIQDFNKKSGGTCNATTGTPKNCEKLDLSTDSLNQDSIKKYADKNVLLYSGSFENKAVLIVGVNNPAMSCTGPGPSPSPSAVEIAEATSIDEMAASFEKTVSVPVDLESYPGYGDGKVNSLFGDGQSSDGSSIDYTELELNQIRMILLTISQSQGIQDLMKDVGVKGIEILNPNVNKIKEPFVAKETKKGKRVKIGEPKLYIPLYTSEDEILQALAAGIIEKEDASKENIKEKALKVDEARPRKHETREPELGFGDTVKLQLEEQNPLDE
jgi:hypothetical protein